MNSIKALTRYNFLTVLPFMVTASGQQKWVKICITILLLSLLGSGGCLFPASNQQKASLKQAPLIYLSGQTIFYSDQPYTLSWQKGENFPPSSKRLFFSLYQDNRPIIKQPLKYQFPLTITIQYPQLRTNVIIKVTMAISIGKSDGVQQVIFSHDCYFVSQDWKTGLKGKVPGTDVGVIDRSPDGAFKNFLSRSGMDFVEISSIESFHGRWLFCSGLDFLSTPTLLEELLSKAVLQGISVAIFPPLAGWCNLPAHGEIQCQMMGNENIWQTIDGRLNPVTASAGPSAAAVYFQYSTLKSQIGIKCSPQGPGYSWVELSGSKARLYLCGWDVIKMTPFNPTGIILIDRLLTTRILGEEASKREPGKKSEPF